MKVIATAVGYDNVALRQPGEIFDCPKGKDGKEIVTSGWYKPHEGKAKPEKGKAKPEADTGGDAESAGA